MEQELEPGTRLLGESGSYTIIQKINYGGYANIYRAKVNGWSSLLRKREVAVKVFKEGLPNQSLVPAMITREVEVNRLLRQRVPRPLRRQWIMLVDVAKERTGDTPSFLVFELCRGDCLIDTGFFVTRRSIIEVTTQILERLCFLKKLGWVHLDISRENVLIPRPAAMLTEDPSVCLIDFGCALPLDETRFNNHYRTLRARRVLDGNFVSMTPERAQGRLNFRQALAQDIFGVGVILYQNFCGSHPYYADKREPGDMLLAIANQVPLDPNVLLRERWEQPLPDPLADLMLRSVDRDWRKRFAGPEDMLQALRSVAAGLNW